MNILSKKRTKIIFLMISIIIFLASILLLTKYHSFKISKASLSAEEKELLITRNYEEFEDGDEAVEGTDNVKFSAFFLRDIDGDGYAEKLKGTCREIGQNDTLYMEINVLSEGILKDAIININGQNFKLATSIPRDEQIKKSVIGEDIKQIELNDMSNGTQRLINGIVSFSTLGNNINNYSRNDNKIILTGTYVKGDGTEIDIQKTIELTTDWHGSTRTTIYNKELTYGHLVDRINEENKTIDINFTIETNELNNKLAISKNHLEIEIPEFNGQKPKSVSVLTSNVDYSYDEEIQKLVIERTAEVDENGNIIKSVARRNLYNISVIYPYLEEIENNSLELLFPTEEYYEGFNNNNVEFENPFRSNVDNSIIKVVYLNREEDNPDYPDPEPTNPYTPIADHLNATIGKYVSQPYGQYIISKKGPLQLYKGIDEEIDDTYTVYWLYYKGNYDNVEKAVLKEDSSNPLKSVDNFLDVNGNYTSMEEIVSNIGIYFDVWSEALNDEGEIKVYDDELGSLLLTLNKSNISRYTASNPFYYSSPVKHIRIELTGINKNRKFEFYNIKKLDDEYIVDNFTEEYFDSLKKIKTNVALYRDGSLYDSISRSANYDAPLSVATLRLGTKTISTQVTENNTYIYISAERNNYNNYSGWLNGIFCIKIPDEIINTEIVEVNTNKASVEIDSYEYFENENGKFIKIYTSNKEPEQFEIAIKCNITPDPRINTATRNFELYAYNEEGYKYYYEAEDIYDINNNNNFQEKINNTSAQLTLIAPSSLLTNEIITEFDNNGTVVISPSIAELTPKVVNVSNSLKTAKIGIHIKNNYSSEIDEIVILGRIPAEGNKSVITEKDLCSTYTTQMVSNGIEIPEELQGKDIDIYYSVNPNASKEINAPVNQWKKYNEVNDWSQIKSYLIDLKDNKITESEEYTFYYKVQLPNTLSYNDVSFSHHAVYFCLNTDEGKYRSYLEPNKIGLRIAGRYDVELVKYQKGKNKTIEGATYSLSSSDGETKTATTNASGEIIFRNLFVEKEYEIKEIRTPNNYELNDNIVKFYAHADIDGNINVEKIEGTTREEIVSDNNEKHLAIIAVEDEVKTGLKIVKKSLSNNSPIKKVIFNIKGEGLPETGINLRTNEEGIATINDLYVGKEYILTETKANGYYLSEPITFSIVNQNGVYSINTSKAIDCNVTEEAEIPIATMNLFNEEIPTFNLIINKTEKNNENNKIAGAKFKLSYNNKIIGFYETNTDGQIIIDNLYQYESSKDVAQTYKLSEIYAPDGYILDSDIIFKVEKIDGVLNVQEEVKPGKTPHQYTAENNNIYLHIEEVPSFSLIKKDGETGEVLPGTKFAIYDIGRGRQPAKNSKGEILGNKEIIDGNEIYVLVTNENGEISVDLQQGLYEAVEIETGEKYCISNISNYFQIGSNINDEDSLIVTDGKKYFGDTYHDLSAAHIASSADGGYLTVFSYETDNLILDEDTLEGYPGYSNFNIAFIKYDNEGSYEWARVLPQKRGNTFQNLYVKDIIPTKDNGFIMYGNFGLPSIDLGNGLIIYRSTLTANFEAGFIMKLGGDGEFEWAKSFNQYYRGENSVNKVAEIDNDEFIAIERSYNSYYLIRFDLNGNIKYEEIIDYGVGDILPSENGGFFVTGTITSDFDFGNNIFLDYHEKVNNNDGSGDMYIAKFNEDNECESAVCIGGVSSEEPVKAIRTRDGDYLIVCRIDSKTVEINGEYAFKSTNDGSTFILKFGQDLSFKWAKQINNLTLYSWDIDELLEEQSGNYLIGFDINFASLENSSIDIGDGVILQSTIDRPETALVQIGPDGTINWGQLYGGFYSSVVKCIDETNSGKIMLIRTVGLEENTYGNHKLSIIKTDTNGNIEDELLLGGTGNDQIADVAKTTDGGFALIGTFTSSEIDLENGNILQAQNNRNGYVIKIMDQSDIPEKEELIVNNYRKEFKVTTDICEIDGNKGGTISGEDENPYEIVKYGDDSENEIIIVPNANYQIIDIKVNGEDYSFEENLDGSYTMPQFTNMTEDKHVVVTFALKSNTIIINKVDSLSNIPISGVKFKLEQIMEDGVTELYETNVITNSEGKAITQIPFGKYKITEIETPKEYIELENPIEIEFRDDENSQHEITIPNERKGKVIVHHYIKDTEEKLTEDEELYGKVGEKYFTSPHIDFEKYELEKNLENEYILPNNANGEYVVEDTIVSYYYVPKQIPLIVHHYIEGTEEKVPLKNGLLKEDEYSLGTEEQAYTTQAVAKDLLNSDYELKSIPINAEGKYEYENVEVTYLYGKAKRNVTITKYKDDGTTPLEGATFAITKENDNFYIERTTDTNGKIEVLLEAGTYEITEIGAPLGYEVSNENTQTITIDHNSEDITISFLNKRKEGTVTVHHYLNGTNTPIDNDVILTGYFGDNYNTRPTSNLPNDMVVVNAYPEKYTGQYIDGNIEVTYYYKAIQSYYEIHYFYDGVEKPSKVEYIEADIGDEIVDYIDKNIPGYKLEKTENIPLIVSENEENNKINIYYVKDEFGYSIHYFYDDVEDENELITGVATYKDVINTYPDKNRDHYSLDKVETIPLIISEDERNNVINVYYLSDKYDYEIHYYYNGLEDTSKIERESAKYGISISSYPDKIIDNYTLVREENYPLVITDNENIINIYYESEKTFFNVEKIWNINNPGEEDNYRATVKLKKSINEVVSDATDLEGKSITRTIIGNSSARFEDIPKYEFSDEIKYTAEEIKIEKTTDGGITWNELPISKFETQYQENSINNNTIVEEVEIGINDGVFKSYNGNNNLFGISMTKSDILSFSRNTSLTKDEVLAKSGVTRIDNTETGDYYSNKEIYGWIEDNNFYWWSEADEVYFHPNTTNAFRNYYNCTTIDLTGTNSSLVRSFNNWFRQDNYSDTKFTTLIGALDTRNATDMAFMFYDCNKLTAVDTSKFNTSNVTTMDRMFGTMRSIQSLDVSMFDTSKVTNMYWMFRYCYAEELDLTSFDTSNVTNMQGMFVSSQYRLHTIKLGPKFNTSKVTNMADMFSGCTKLTTIYAVNDFDTSSVTNSNNMFNNDTLLVGEAGTTYSTAYDSTKKDKTYARIAVEGLPGYFTHYDPEEEKNSIIITNTEKDTHGYKIYYKEQGTEIELAEPKEVDNLNIGDTITETAIDIIGYEKIEPTSTIITIQDEASEYTFYYTKGTDFSYIVNYLEKDSNKVLHEPKVQGGMTFEQVVNSSDEVITIDGYNFSEADKETLTIGTDENIINLYYAKKNNLSYTIHYKEQGTERTLSQDKVVENQTFGEKVTENAIDINGYNKIDPTSVEITIQDGANEHTFYYTKRADLDYTVNYLEKGTNNIVHESKTEQATFEQVINAVDEEIVIDGYTHDSNNPESITIKVDASQNILNIYYTKRTDIHYIVNYLEKDTNKVLETQKISTATFDEVIDAANEEITIKGYVHDSNSPESIRIKTDETQNVLNIYYTKKTNLGYTVYYKEQGTEATLSEAKVVTNQTYGEKITENAIDIVGYNKVNPTTTEIIIQDGVNEYTFYYTKKNNLSYTIHYKEQGTERTLSQDKVVENKTFEEKVTENAIDINGYNKVNPTSVEITIQDGVNEHTFYYTKRVDLDYTVNYLEKDSNKVLREPKVQGNMTFEQVVSSSDEVIAIDGYNFSEADKETLTIGTGENVINLYYTKRTDLSYTVYYKEQGTEATLADPKLVTGQTFGSKVTENAININGYTKVEPTQTEITITTGTNEHTFYYAKRTDLSYTVNYLEKDSNRILHDSKNQGNMTFEQVVNTIDEIITIDGFNFAEADKETLTIGTGENVINLYYIKKSDLSYTVNYLEKGSNKVIHTQKTAAATFEQVINAQDEEIAIDGYTHDSNSPTSITVGVDASQNVLNIYYNKRSDLSYTVHYYEEGTTTKVAEDKIVTGQTFGNTITENAIDVSGYNKVEPISKDVTITTGTNEIAFYYTKKNDLNYTIHYKEQGSERTLSQDKTVGNQTFGEKVTEEAIEINGYNRVNPITVELTIQDGTNEHTFYYTKRVDLSYTVNYLEKDSNKVLHEPKTQGNMIFEQVVRSSDEVIAIDGYNFSEADKETLTIGTDENVINLYYTKKSDLDYTVNYLEKDSNKVLHEPKIQGNMIFEQVVNAEDEVITIDGYNFSEADKNTLTIGTGENVINLFYTKRTDLSYIVHYYEEGTTNKVADDKVVENQIFGNTITENAIDISGYNKVDPTSKDMTITTGTNEIVFYYAKKTDLSYTIHYKEEGTNKVLAQDKVVGNQTFGNTITENAIDIVGYNKVNPTTTEIKIQDGVNEYTFYYTKKNDLSYTIHYKEQGTERTLSQDKVVGNKTFEEKVTENAIDINGYNKVDPTSVEITIQDGVNEHTFYYTKRNDLSYTVNYLEKDSNKVLREPKVQGNMTFEQVVSSSDEVIAVDGYNFKEADKNTLTIGTGENVINLYYTKRTDLGYTVYYKENGTNNTLADPKVVTGKTFEEKVTENANNINGYTKVEPTQAEITITTGTNEHTFYYEKRTDLSYVVYYKEYGSETELRDSKTVTGKTYLEEVQSINEYVDISGYNFKEVNPDSITISYDLAQNVITIYYTKKTDLSYTVYYKEQGTNINVANPKVVDGQTLGNTITENAIDVTGYNKVGATSQDIVITAGNNELTFYYAKKSDLSYTIHYKEEGTNNTLAQDKVVGNQTFGNKVTENAIDIDGYNKVNPTTTDLTILDGVNEYTFYYKKRADLSYVVHYKEEGTNNTLAQDKVVNDQTFNDKVQEEAIDINGYNKVNPTNVEITITTGLNEHTFYYTKRNDLSYKVNYLEKDTDRVLKDQKVQNGVTFEQVINSTDEVVEIDGFNFSEADKQTLTIGTGENEINLYYTKKTDLSYTINYLEKDSNAVLHEPKVQGDMTFEKVINSEDEVIPIDGYNFSEADKNTLTIGTGENVINLYYTKRTDLSYIVHYYEEGTTNKVADDKNVSDQTFGSRATEKAVDVIGYNKVDPVEKSIDITTGTNEIFFYYAKRTDLAYCIFYRELNTEEVLAQDKLVENQRFGDVIHEEAIDIGGYNKVDPTELDITITAGTNEYTFYYTKKTDLDYTVHYKEEGTELELAPDKAISNQTFGDKVHEVAIDIDGYNKVDPSEVDIDITVGANEHTFYYTKRVDLDYIVHYKEDGTDKELASDKHVSDQTFGDKIHEEALDIDGYNKIDPIEADIDITTGVNEHTFYYDKKSDLEYKVRYVDKTTNEEIEDAKVVKDVTFETEVKAEDEIKTFYKYDFVEYDKEKIIVGTNPDENVITLYYIKKNASVVVHYYEDGTTNSLSLDKLIEGKVDDHYETTEADDIPIIYELVEEPYNKEGNMTVDQIEVIYYYKLKGFAYTINYLDIETGEVVHDPKQGSVVNGTIINSNDEIIDIEKYDYNSVDKDSLEIGSDESQNIINIYYIKKNSKVTTHYYIEGTEQRLSDDVIIEGKVDTEYHTYPADDINNDYELVEDPINKDGVITVEPIEVIYNYKLKDTKVVVNYIDMITNETIADEVVIDGKVRDSYQTEKKDIENYTFIEDSQNTIGEMTVDTIYVNYYYKHNAKVIVNYIYRAEDGTEEKLKTKEEIGLEGDTITTMPEDFEGYVLEERPDNETITMTVEPIIVNYYYVKVSQGLIEKHIDDVTDELLYEELHTGKEGDPYQILPKEFDRYELNENKLPDNSEGTLKEGLMEVIYYYSYQAKVTINYVDIEKGENLLDPIVKEGRLGDNYTSEEKEIEKYEFIEVKGNPEGTFEKDDIVVNYYYRRLPTKVIENHIDDTTSDILYNDEKVLEEGDPYSTEPKTFDEYDIITEKLPSNGSGEMGEEDIVINYYYIRKAMVNVEYIDFFTGKNVTKPIEFKGHVGDDYESEEQTVPGYKLVKEQYPENSKGTMTKDPITVTYFYVKEAKVTEKHIYKNRVLQEDTHKGLEGDPYEIKPKTFENYIVDSDNLPDNSKGYMEENEIVVIYRYVDKAIVTEKHIDEDTKIILAEETHEGKRGDRYDISPRTFNGYEYLYTSTENNRGEMTDEPIEVLFWYKKVEKKATPTPSQSQVEPTQAPVTVIIKDGSKTTTVIPKSDDTIVKNTTIIPKVDPDYEIVRNVPDTESNMNVVFYLASKVIILIGISLFVIAQRINKKKNKK